MLDSDTGELEEKTLEHQDETVREFYSALSGPILVGIEATGSMQWFLEMLEELGIECRVGHPAKIRKAETRKQNHDRRDARLLLTLLAENRFAARVINGLRAGQQWEFWARPVRWGGKSHFTGVKYCSNPRRIDFRW
jgi:transposase